MKSAKHGALSPSEIAAELRRVMRGWERNGSPSATHIATQVERTLLAVLEVKPYHDPINAAFTAGAAIQRGLFRRAVAEAWNAVCPPCDIVRTAPAPKRKTKPKTHVKKKGMM